MCRIAEETQKRANGGREQTGSIKATLQSKYLEQRQEAIMRKFYRALPVLTSVTLRGFGVGSVTGTTVLFSHSRT